MRVASFDARVFKKQNEDLQGSWQQLKSELEKVCDCTRTSERSRRACVRSRCGRSERRQSASRRS